MKQTSKYIILLIIIVIVLTEGLEYIEPIEIDNNHEIIKYSKMIPNKCYLTKDTSKKFVQIKGIPFILNFGSKNCDGTETYISQAKDEYIYQLSPKSIASFVPTQSTKQLSPIYITDKCGKYSNGGMQYQIENDTLIQYVFDDMNCTGNKKENKKYLCGDIVDNYSIECSKAYSLLFTVFTSLSFIFLI